MEKMKLPNTNLQILHHLHSLTSLRSLSSSSSMDVKKIFKLEHDKKENIPPFSPLMKPSPNVKKVKCTLVKVNKGRRPLRDVTNVYTTAGRAHFRLPSSVSVSGSSSNRKRKLVDDDAHKAYKSCSKILRKEFR